MEEKEIITQNPFHENKENDTINAIRK